MKRLLIGVAIAAALFATPVCADEATPAPVQLPAVTVVPVPSQTVAVPAPAATQNTITTSGPVTSETTISGGDIAGAVLKWVAALVTGVLGLYGRDLIIKLGKRVGVQLSEAFSDQINATLVNGLNHAAATEEANLAGKDPIVIKNKIIQGAIAYTQTHRADAIKSLGLDPQSGLAVQALEGRIATLIADPTVPTPAMLDPAPKPLAVPAVKAAAAPAAV